MSRKPRLHFPGALYHIIGRGNNGQETYLSRNDFLTFQKYMARVKERKKCKIYAYCLMPNHYHLLLEVIEFPIWELMQRLLTAYTLYFNRVHNRYGHLFQGRYKAILCQKESYLLELVRYIHLNPVRAGIVNSPSEWEWSGHISYLTGKKDSLLEKSAVLSRFSSDIESARRRYGQFVEDGVHMGHRTDLYPNEQSPYLGKEKFVDDLSIKHAKISQKMTSELLSYGATLTDILNRIVRRRKISPSRLKGSSRLEVVSEARRAFAREAFSVGYKGVDISRFLGCSPSLLSKILKREEEEAS